MALAIEVPSTSQKWLGGFSQRTSGCGAASRIERPASGKVTKAVHATILTRCSATRAILPHAAARPRSARLGRLRGRVGAAGCRASGGGPATRQRSRADRAGPTGRHRRLWIPRARTPGHRLPRRLPGGRLGRRRRGGVAGGLREGLARPAALPDGVALSALAARHRRQRGAQPPPRRRPPRGPGPARGRAGRATRGQRRRLAGDARAGRRAPPDAAGRPRGPRPARPRGPHLPLPARALRGGDGRRARVPAGHGQVADLARPRAPARPRRCRGGGGAVTELELQLLALRAEVAWPPTPDLATAVQARVAREPRERARRGRRAWLRGRLVPALVAVLVVLIAFGALLAASPNVRATLRDWLGIGSVRIARVHSLPDISPARQLDLGRRATVAQANAHLGSPHPPLRAPRHPDRPRPPPRAPRRHLRRRRTAAARLGGLRRATRAPARARRRWRAARPAPGRLDGLHREVRRR